MYVIGSELSQAERGTELTEMLGSGKNAARKLKRAQILLAADGGLPRRGDCPDRECRPLPSAGPERRFVEGNLERALSEEPRPGAERKLTGKEEALLVATACAKPPAGCKRWTLTLLAGHDGHAHRSQQSVGRDRASPAGRERPSSRGAGTCGAFRMSTANTLPAWRTCSTSTPRRRIPARPLVCFDETPHPADRRGAPAGPGPTGTARALRLRVSPQRHRQSLRHLRSTSGLAQRQGHRPPRRRGLRPLHA